ncbi:Crotonobetainyl-CoA:carnitine CoA-transferase CaiB [Variovorax sp. HW608]|uniref:CaiB/BaiF CoA transferase family protein n=1 Tax=Variovorax sp. HW608 TaxID=1034889 RepID=UPI00081F9393|nr:CoA transferase [Variovorax sp. HW608]SCK42791.1 Crotonobetainyl-CoA:carnitine CoA-transferase CaiB [Variovorax sp. HW608]
MNGPLAGCRVLDLGIITAGAATSAMLADLGAQVIKVESPGYHDPFRRWSGPGGAGDSPFFRFTNRNKQGIGIDIKRPEGRAVFMRLVARSDVVVENFRRGVLAKLGIDYPQLREVRPSIILASLSSHGEFGPDAERVSFGTTLEAMSGLAAETGYDGGTPTVSGRDLNYPDQVVAIFAAGMVATAWPAAQGGQGVHLDLSQRELTSFLLGERFVQGASGQPRGNVDPLYALQDCYAARDHAWIAVSVEQRQLSSLAALVADSAVGLMQDRLARWIATRTAEEAVEALAALGIAAAPVGDGRAVAQRRGIAWREAIGMLPDGSLAKGFPFQFEEEPMRLMQPAPSIGQDTAQVLQEVGGYTPQEIAALRKDGVIECADA